MSLLLKVSRCDGDDCCCSNCALFLLTKLLHCVACCSKCKMSFLRQNRRLLIAYLSLLTICTNVKVSAGLEDNCKNSIEGREERSEESRRPIRKERDGEMLSNDMVVPSNSYDLERIVSRSWSGLRDPKDQWLLSRPLPRALLLRPLSKYGNDESSYARNNYRQSGIVKGRATHRLIPPSDLLLRNPNPREQFADLDPDSQRLLENLEEQLAIQKRRDFVTDLGKRFDEFRTDLGKRRAEETRSNSRELDV